MKKLLSLFLAGTMLFSLAACGEETEEKEKSKNNSDIVEDGGDYSDEYAETQIGSYITFGSYEQDNDTSNGKEPIEWLVLEKQGNKVLVISKYALDCKPYNEVRESISWETCTLRSWLNDEFINEAFTSEEKECVPVVVTRAEDSSDYGTEAGNDTEDKVFLLSVSEVFDYFDTSSPKNRTCEATAYAIEQCATSYVREGACVWWLRSPGYDKDQAAYVEEYGGVGVGGMLVDDILAVRPAMWIEL